MSRLSWSFLKLSSMISRASRRSSASAHTGGNCDLNLLVGHAIFEFLGAPAGAPIERQPLVHRPAVGLQVEREHAGVGDRVVRAVENVVRFLAVVVHRFAGDLGDGAAIVTERQAGHAAHVAILALNALLARGRRAVLLPHHFELDARMHGHLVAGRAELAARERLEIDAGDVDVLAGAWFVRPGFDFEFVFAGDRVGHAIAADAAEHRGEDVARFDAPLAVRFSVGVLHAVAGDAGDAFAGGFRQFPQRLIARGAERRGHRCVATHAEVADRALRQVVEPLLELVEHRRDGRVGVGRDAPLVVNLFVADGAFAGRGIGVFGEQLQVRIDGGGRAGGRRRLLRGRRWGRREWRVCGWPLGGRWRVRFERGIGGGVAFN